nr:RNA-directed DNA polymerase, eukaryota, reverse transcriptase zinc-binding domain protein [Tanacetum cinerariifolium]
MGISVPVLETGTIPEISTRWGDTMVGKRSTNIDSNGWTWIFRKNKQETSHPIRNMFQKEVEKVATSFFVTNFPEHIDAKGLWKVCEPYGRIVDAFIANKRSKVRKRFGFVRFIGVKNEENFAKSLASIWIGTFHTYAFVARFQRQEQAEAKTKEMMVKARGLVSAKQVGCVLLPHKMKFISEMVKVDINGEEYDLHIHELGSWSINIVDPLSSNSKTDPKVDDDYTNEEESECE